MGNTERDRVIGSAYVRYKEAKRQVACLETEMRKMGRDLLELGKALENGMVELDHEGNLWVILGYDAANNNRPVRNAASLPSEEDVKRAVKQLENVRAEQESASSEWEKLK